MVRYKYLDTLVLIFVVVLLVSNLVAQKVCRLGPLTISGAELLFPITYIFGDVFTEVYGYKESRRAIWIGFLASALLSAAGALAVALPADPGWHNQAAFETVFGLVPRFVAASLIAYWVGEFANAFTLARLKVLTRGRWLWTRTIGSTVVGQAFDTVLVMVISFAGQVSTTTLVRLILSSYLIKVVYETLATPVTYAGVAWLKQQEGIDPFDTHTDFNPFAFRNPTAESAVKVP
ncbi:MAG TPA: queuosine precursor transporter [Acidobacteriaceae bacterium]|nr:queuosine precursor transporter [Acidobacteriaceae bacterium]